MNIQGRSLNPEHPTELCDPRTVNVVLRAGIPGRAMAAGMELRAQFVAGGELRIDGGCQTGTRSS
jgi:hypothetical protein